MTLGGDRRETGGRQAGDRRGIGGYIWWREAGRRAWWRRWCGAPCTLDRSVYSPNLYQIVFYND